MDEQEQREALVRRYHEQTKHYPGRYARSLGYMDWANQPEPFRDFGTTERIPLPLLEADPRTPHLGLYQRHNDATTTLHETHLAGLLELSMGLSAWKSAGGSRWALRMNPSSGNLHPTECYVILPKLGERAAMVAHYHPYHHALEVRAVIPDPLADRIAREFGEDGFGIVLSTIVWREAWKYGERAVRYTQHDAGHALAAIRVAANLFGWRVTLLEQAADRDAAILLGFDETAWHPEESEHIDLMAWVHPPHRRVPLDVSDEIIAGFQPLHFRGSPNRLSNETVRWDIIHETLPSLEKPRTEPQPPPGSSESPLRSPARSEMPAADIIRARRSAQMFDGKSVLDRASFYAMLDKTLPRQAVAPFDAWPFEVNVDLLLFVHRVAGLVPGLYLLSRSARLTQALRAHITSDFAWAPVTDTVPLLFLRAGDVQEMARDISCGQDIAGDSAFSLGMLARFDAVIARAPWRYKTLFFETGMIGQVLYLEAEAHGMRGTGIGCFFDDIVHQLLGFEDTAFQSLYHFTVGAPLEDRRIATSSPYEHLESRQRR